jgi:5,10-methylene-tetrahydrofolate dehydrogenase/methenyl tetrahydrofolate cyclohydrolase
MPFKNRDTAEICRNSEIMIVAAGKTGMADSSFFNKNQIVIDVASMFPPAERYVAMLIQKQHCLKFMQ